ncbi:CHAP domain-containing protein [Leuconostoc palmae]|uniref:CHAP domain-containing protein n=1 Tax=Leuconostoc palmae TaxID=501487 RepID=UPI001C7CFDFE|nr:CHAP domain-containing protein [Leuconostoc palmae]
MKKVIVSLLTAGVIIGMGTHTISAAVHGDDYPNNLKLAHPDTLVDSWRMYNRECVSFVAWRLHSQNHFELPQGFGSAWQWRSQALAKGYQVDQTPAVGSVAWFSAGHVGWVADVLNNGQVVIEEYNYGFNHTYYRRTINKTAVTGFIHFKDINQGPIDHQTSPTLSSPTTIQAGQTIKFSGVYRVTRVNAQKNTIACDQLSGGSSTALNYIDAGPLDKTHANGVKHYNQILSPGDYFKVNGQYRVLAVDRPSNGIKVKIGVYNTWLDMNQVSRIN